MPCMMYLKVKNYRVSLKLFSMCDTEYAEGGAKLHHPPSPVIGLIEGAPYIGLKRQNLVESINVAVPVKVNRLILPYLLIGVTVPVK